ILTGKCPLEVLLDPFAFALVANTVEDKPKIGAFEECVRELPSEIGFRVLIDRHVLDFTQRSLSLLEAITDRFRGKPGPVLDTTEAFLLGSGDNLAIADEAGGCVAVEGVDAEDRRHRAGTQIVPVSSHRRNRMVLRARPGQVKRGSQSGSAPGSMRAFATVA